MAIHATVVQDMDPEANYNDHANCGGELFPLGTDSTGGEFITYNGCTSCDTVVITGSHLGTMTLELELFDKKFSVYGGIVFYEG